MTIKVYLGRPPAQPSTPAARARSLALQRGSILEGRRVSCTQFSQHEAETWTAQLSPGYNRIAIQFRIYTSNASNSFVSPWRGLRRATVARRATRDSGIWQDARPMLHGWMESSNAPYTLFHRICRPVEEQQTNKPCTKPTAAHTRHGLRLLARWRAATPAARPPGPARRGHQQRRSQSESLLPAYLPSRHAPAVCRMRPHTRYGSALAAGRRSSI